MSPYLLDRRRVLLGGASLLGALSNPALAAALRRPREERDGRSLVLIQLSGGNDGLSTVVPFADDAYGRARDATRIDAKDVLRLDDYRGLHPELRTLRALDLSGRLAIVEGVGHSGPPRSHFKAMDIWHAADESGRVAGHGWLGRLAETAWADELAPELLVHVGAKAPYSMYSPARAALAFERPEAYRWMGDAGQQRALAWYDSAAREEGTGALARMREVLRDARASSARVRAAVAAYEPRVEYPADDFGQGLCVIAALLEARLGARVLSIELGGFDTHNAQKGTHDGLMRTLDRALSAFFRDIRGRSFEQDVLVAAFSEFGRRVQENGSRGTDHGKAAPMFLAGEAVRGGLYGRHPSLDELDDGDLAHTTDFRSVYATIVERWFGADPAAVLGAEYPQLELV